MSVADILADPDYPELKKQILDHTGLWFYADKDEDFACRIGRRFAARGTRTCDEYRSLLGNPAAGKEIDGLVGELTIGETYFFRQHEHFDILRDTIFPDLLERCRAARRLRIWSAGCATGAEPYSIDMLLELEMEPRVAGWEISIVATDINSDFLARARTARFGAWAFRETPEWIQLRCFVRHGSSWELRPEFRRRVSFQHHNLATGEPLSIAPFDLVMCRNVMIYFAPDLFRLTVARFYDALAPGGWLLVGHAEPNMSAFAQFRQVHAGAVTVYQKPERRSAAPPAAPEPIPLPAPPAALRQPRFPPPPLPVTAPPVEPSPALAAPGFDEVRLLADRGEWARAAALGRRLTEEEPLLAIAHFTLGLILEHTESCREAERSLRRAIYLDRRFVLAHYHLGACLQRERRTEHARRAFRNVLQLLGGLPPEETVEHGDGMTVAELRELSRMHVELLGGA